MLVIAVGGIGNGSDDNDGDDADRKSDGLREIGLTITRASVVYITTLCVYIAASSFLSTSAVSSV